MSDTQVNYSLKNFSSSLTIYTPKEGPLDYTELGPYDDYEVPRELSTPESITTAIDYLIKTNPKKYSVGYGSSETRFSTYLYLASKKNPRDKLIAHIIEDNSLGNH